MSRTTKKNVVWYNITHCSERSTKRNKTHKKVPNAISFL